MSRIFRKDFWADWFFASDPHRRFSLVFGINIIFNDLIWWIPFAHILWTTWNRRSLKS